MRRSIRLSGVTIAVYAIVSIVAVLTTSALAVLELVFVAIATTLVAVFVAFALARFVRRIASLLVVSAIVGAVRGVTLVALLASLRQASAADLLRVVNSTVSAVIWITIISLIVSARDGYRERYMALVRQVASARHVERLDSLPELVDLKAVLGAAARSATMEPSLEDLRAAAAVLRGEIEDRVRPLSHRIWFSARSLQPHVRLGGLIRDGVSLFCVPVWPVVGVWTFTALLGAPVVLGVTQGVLSAMYCAVCLLGVLLASRWIVGRVSIPGLGVVLVLASSVLPVALTTGLMGISGVWAVEDRILVTDLLVVVSTGALLVAAAALSLANADLAQILGIVETRVNAAEPWPSTDVSSYLHNSLQSELVGLALQLDRAVPGSDQAREAVERLSALASRSIADDFRSQRETPLERLAAGAAAWRGIADVVVDVDPSVDAADPRLAMVAQAAQEVTSNAIRHGEARMVRIRVHVSGSRLVAELWSDGAYRPKTEAGMGAQWLSSVVVSPVEIRPSADGTLVVLEF